jgi:hypothetical protein
MRIASATWQFEARFSTPREKTRLFIHGVRLAKAG